MYQSPVRDNSLATTNKNSNQSPSDRVPLTEEQIQLWLTQLEQWTTNFYNPATNQTSPALWQEAQTKLVSFQKLHDPVELCVEILKRSHNSLVLYQAALCLRNAVAYDFKKYEPDELFKIFQFLFDFLSTRAMENENSVNETVALICAMILKRIASERARVNSETYLYLDQRAGRVQDKDEDKIGQVITTLCTSIKDANDYLGKKLTSALIINSLLVECQLTNRSSFLGLHMYKHLNSRVLIELRLKTIIESCLESTNWAFKSNLLNPSNQTREVQVLFHLVGTLIKCVEYSLSFNSSNLNSGSGSERDIFWFLNCRTFNLPTAPQRMVKSWTKFVMTPSVVQFLFDLYTTVKSMINCVPGWQWPADILKNCLNCLYYLSDVHNYTNCEKNDEYAEFVGNLMLGCIKIMELETRGIDDIFQIASLMTSISLHTSDSKEIIPKLKVEQFTPFLDAAQRFTTKVFIHVASSSVEEEEEEEKTVDALLDFWYQLLRNVENDIRRSENVHPPQIPRLSSADMRGYARMITECYISCHLHKPLGHVVYKPDDAKEVDLEQADEQDDNSVHIVQLITFGLISRFDSLHTAKLLIDLSGARLNRLEELLTQHINQQLSPDGLNEWEIVNDDLHWLLLMIQHFLTQTGYAELGFMCNEIVAASLTYDANVDRTVQGFEKCDFNSNEVDPIVRLVLIAIKLCQIEMEICKSGKIHWLSVQTNRTLTSFLSRFCLTYLYPKESDYTVISENMNYCFGQDSPTADQFLKYVIEHTCCIILHLKSEPNVVNKNIQLLIQLLSIHLKTKDLMINSSMESFTKLFLAQLKPEHLTGFSSKVAKALIQLTTRLFVDADGWGMLIDFFSSKWKFIMEALEKGEHRNELVSGKLLEFCDFAIGVCEACDDEISERLFEQLLVPIVQALPEVMRGFNNFDAIPIAVFDLLYNIVKYPLVHIGTWESLSASSFYENCSRVIEAFVQNETGKTNRGDEEEDCEDIISVLTFCNELMKRDWGNALVPCDSVVKFAIEHLSTLIKPDYFQFPRIRSTYYRLLVYLVDEKERLATLNDRLLEMIVCSILLSLRTQFDKETDNHTYTVIGIICRAIYDEKDTPLSERLSKYMMPVLPALFEAAMSQGSFTLNMETVELIAPALFSMRCCFTDQYKQLVQNLIDKQDNEYARSKVKSLFENLESRIQKLPLTRASCRDFNSLFVPFMSELNQYISLR